MNTKNGVFSDEFQLSDLPSLGEWILMATVGDQVSLSELRINFQHNCQSEFIDLINTIDKKSYG